MAVLARVPSSAATFVETRHIAALTAPVVRQGSLFYVRPGQLEMVVDRPIAERVRIDDDRMTIESRTGTTQIRLSEIPAAAAWVESVRATLAGDGAVLRRHFRVRATGELPQWTLELIPLDIDLAALVERITIAGAEARLARIEVDERSGDRSVMLITPADGRR